MKYDPFSLKGNGTLDGTILSVMILVISLVRRRAFFRGEGGWGLGVGGGREKRLRDEPRSSVASMLSSDFVNYD